MSRILITDDSSSQRTILSIILQKLGHEVEMAGNGQEALEKIEANPPDCMLLDNLMPVMDGLQTLEALQARNITLPIIMLTADLQEWLRIRCLELGAAVFLNKPTKEAQLKEALQQILSTPQSSEVPCT
ncbi:MAG: response regulator [Nitrospirota bacterium]|nr:response regulator [Nitrospirota bacterium]MDH5585300.1 response regulator [Nitrospirota bacterium]MDH5773736.1 response regulator [Nitrospirota bacterium]